MRADSPLVSVVIAVRNGERFLAQAIESVLSQTYSHHEIIVVDGRSSDNSRLIAESYGCVRCIEQEGNGFADAWNLGIASARGELIAILDSDDWWAPGKLAAQTELLAREPQTQYVITRMRFVLEPGHDAPPGFKRELLDTDHPAYMPSALLARKQVFETLGVFVTSLEIASDVEWFARAKDRQLILGIVPEVMLFKRVHNSNLSYLDSHTRRFNREVVVLLKQSIDRQRAQKAAAKTE